MINSDVSERLLLKLKALRDMSEGAANEHESLVALRQLHALLAKHNLSISEVEVDNDRIGAESFSESNSRAVFSIISSIARLYFCRVVQTRRAAGARRKSVTDYTIAGTASDRACASAIIALVLATLRNELRASAKRDREAGRATGASYRTSFMKGASWRVQMRCQELIDAAKAGLAEDEQGCKLPALAHQYDARWQDAQNHLGQLFSNLTRPRRARPPRSTTGFYAGVAAGDRAPLNRPLEAAEVARLPSPG